MGRPSLPGRWPSPPTPFQGCEERRYDGRVAVGHSNTRWCSDGFEIICDNKEKVRVAFVLDCCDRDAMGQVATTEGINGEDICDLMVTAVEHRFGRVNRLPGTIEWLMNNGSSYLAGETRRFARHIGLELLTTPIDSSQSNGMTEAFVQTFKRGYIRVSPCSDAKPSSRNCRNGSSITTRFTRIARWDIVLRASSSVSVQTWRRCPKLKGQQQCL